MLPAFNTWTPKSLFNPIPPVDVIVAMENTAGDIGNEISFVKAGRKLCSNGLFQNKVILSPLCIYGQLFVSIMLWKICWLVKHSHQSGHTGPWSMAVVSICSEDGHKYRYIRAEMHVHYSVYRFFDFWGFFLNYTVSCVWRPLLKAITSFLFYFPLPCPNPL